MRNVLFPIYSNVERELDVVYSNEFSRQNLNFKTMPDSLRSCTCCFSCLHQFCINADPFI